MAKQNNPKKGLSDELEFSKFRNRRAKSCININNLIRAYWKLGFHFYIDAGKEAALKEYEKKKTAALIKFSAARAVYDKAIAEANDKWQKEDYFLRLKFTQKQKDGRHSQSPNKKQT